MSWIDDWSTPFRRRREVYEAIHRAQAEWLRQSGSLYGGADQDVAEARAIREECEAIGLPMGYGRVGRAPTLLADEYMLPLF